MAAVYHTPWGSANLELPFLTVVVVDISVLTYLRIPRMVAKWRRREGTSERANGEDGTGGGIGQGQQESAGGRVRSDGRGSERKRACADNGPAVASGGRDAIEGWQGDILRVRVAAPAIDGRANAALLRLVAHAAGVAPSRVQIIAGEKARQKRLAVEGLTQAELESRLSRPSPRLKRSTEGRGNGEWE